MLLSQRVQSAAPIGSVWQNSLMIGYNHDARLTSAVGTGFLTTVSFFYFFSIFSLHFARRRCKFTIDSEHARKNTLDLWLSFSNIRSVGVLLCEPGGHCGMDVCSRVLTRPRQIARSEMDPLWTGRRSNQEVYQGIVTCETGASGTGRKN